MRAVRGVILLGVLLAGCGSGPSPSGLLPSSAPGVLALFVAGCGFAPSASPAGWPPNLASDWGSTTGIGTLPTGDHMVSSTAR